MTDEQRAKILDQAIKNGTVISLPTGSPVKSINPVNAASVKLQDGEQLYVSRDPLPGMVGISIAELLQARGSEYGDSWSMTGELIKWFLTRYGDTPIFKGNLPFAFNWLIILNKLTRAMYSPQNADHWRDIAGYAKLCSDYLEKEAGHVDSK